MKSSQSIKHERNGKILNTCQYMYAAEYARDKTMSDEIMHECIGLVQPTNKSSISSMVYHIFGRNNCTRVQRRNQARNRTVLRL